MSSANLYQHHQSHLTQQATEWLYDEQLYDHVIKLVAAIDALSAILF